MDTNRTERVRKTGENSKGLDPNDSESFSISSLESEPSVPTSGSNFFVDVDTTESPAPSSSSRPVTPERKKRAKEKRSVGSLRMSLERKMGTVERMLEDRVEKIWEGNVEKHPWLLPIETWIADRCKSSSSGSYSVQEERRRESLDRKAESQRYDVERRVSDAASHDVRESDKKPDETDHESERRLPNATECREEAGQSLLSGNGPNSARGSSRVAEESVADGLGGTEEKLRDMQRVIREVQMNLQRSDGRMHEAERTVRDTEEKTYETEVGTRGTDRKRITGTTEVARESVHESQSEGDRDSVRAQEVEPTFDFKFTTSAKEDEEPRLESRALEHLRSLRRGSPARGERHGFDPAMFISRIRERRDNSKAKESDEQSADGSSGILDVKEVRHHNHDLLDKLKDNVKEKMEDIHRVLLNAAEFTFRVYMCAE